MKILQLRFKNLNSLQGEWLIDFTEPQYLANGIFALTGPTGAGKSTVLDAICLALYGSTPRLGKITRNNNDIMSRQTGECYAEVCFESSEGRFRCHWSQHRARKKANGKLAESKHEISAMDSGEILESKKRNVTQLIEAKTGMDFERFTRSMLLAQGGFDTFLKADVEQKSRILEQITGTEIYTRISLQTHERLKREREQLNLLRAEIAGISLLTEDQIHSIKQTLRLQQEQQNILSGQLNQTQKAVIWLQTIHSISKEIKVLEKDSEQLQIELEQFVPQRKKLELAVRASHLDGFYATLKALRKQQLNDQQLLHSEQSKLPELQQQAANFKIISEQSEQTLQEAKHQLQSAVELFKKVRSVDQSIADKHRSVNKLDNEYHQQQQQIKAEQSAIKKLQKQSAETEQQCQQCASYLQKHSQDQWLISGLAGIKARLFSLNAIEKERELYKQQYNTELQVQKKYQQQFKKQRQALESFAQAFKDIQTQMEGQEKHRKALLNGKLLREYRAEKEALLRELSLLKTIASLETERKKLQDNKACPLCGSLEHPYATGNVPAMDDSQIQLSKLDKIIAQAEQIEQQLNELAQMEKKAQYDLSEAEKQKLKAEHKYSASSQKLKQLEQSLLQLEQESGHLKTELLQPLQALGIAELENTDFKVLLNSLQKRLELWQQQQQDLNELEQKKSQNKADIKTHESIISTLKKSLSVIQQDLKNETSGLQQLLTERQTLFADKEVDLEEKRLKKLVADSEQDEKNARKKLTKCQQTLNSLLTNIHALEARIKQADKDLNEQENSFLKQLPEQGFASETEFIQASLSIKQRQRLNRTAQELDNRQISITTRLTDRNQALQAEQEKNISNKSLDLLLSEQKKLEQQVSAVRDEIATLKHQLEQDQQYREKIKQQQGAIDKQQKECQRWEKLHILIGSSDGKKYRNFAQGLTFELMVNHANRQLKKMSDRYLLIRDKDQPLELNVIDNYQAGEIRSVRNLSGGESFVVSLTLALGLSRMASRKVRVDSLFLDEGFGSLDEDALESALEALSGLHQDGKLIGIISHVYALKERISTRIQVTPLSGGRSTIVGPGCSKL